MYIIFPTTEMTPPSSKVAGRDPDKINAHCLPKPARHPGGYETV
jgi:hypothetical protein